MDNDLLKEIILRIESLEKKIEGLQSTWLDVKQASCYLCISMSKLRKMISDGLIPYKRLPSIKVKGKKTNRVSGKILFSRRQLDLWLIYGKQKGFSKAERRRAEVFI